MWSERLQKTPLVVLLLLFGASCQLLASTNTDEDLLTTVQKYYAAEDYQRVVDLTINTGELPSELYYYRGMALAHLQRWDEAEKSLEDGERKAPEDPRFPTELAGISFKQNNFGSAKKHLNRLLSLDHNNTYGTDFLGTIYLLEDNLEAALKYWNRIGKPVIEGVKTIPAVRLRTDLLDRTFVFSKESQLQLKDLRATEAHLDSLEIFPRYRFKLAAQEEEKFDWILHPVERNGWGYGWISGLLGLTRGVPYGTIYPEFYNLKQSALNSLSLIRWDENKLRLFSSFSGPLKGSPQWRYRLQADARNENWDVTNSYQGPPPPGDLLVDAYEAGVDLRNGGNGGWGWHSSLYLSYRDFGGDIPQVPEAPRLFDSGFALEGFAGVDHPLLLIPEHRFTIESSAEAGLGRTFSQPSNFFSQLKARVDFNWFPTATGDDYLMSGQFRAGMTLGDVPFDEYFILGMERDNNLWLRAHNGIRKKKGYNFMGRDYLLLNWEISKIIYKRPFFQMRLGPFLDAGNIYDVQGGFGSEEWQWDVGLQFKMRILDSITLSPVFGRNLRTGNNVFYVIVSGQFVSRQ